MCADIIALTWKMDYFISMSWYINFLSECEGRMKSSLFNLITFSLFVSKWCSRHSLDLLHMNDARKIHRNDVHIMF